MVNAGDQKERFDRLQPDDSTQEEFMEVLLDNYELTDENGAADVRAVLERLESLESDVIAMTEVAAYRGSKEALNDNE